MSFGRTADEIRETENRRRERELERARAAAHRGQRPDQHLDAGTLALAFKGHEREVAELNAIAARYHKDRLQRERATDRRLMVQSAADAIEKEWAAEARAAAVAEAERRIAAKHGSYGLGEDAHAQMLPSQS